MPSTFPFVFSCSHTPIPPHTTPALTTHSSIALPPPSPTTTTTTATTTATLARLTDLPPALLHDIFLQFEQPTDLYNLACTSRLLNAVTVPLFIKAVKAQSQECSYQSYQWYHTPDLSTASLSPSSSTYSLDCDDKYKLDTDADSHRHHKYHQHYPHLHLTLNCDRYMTSLNVGLHERDALSGLQIDFTTTTLASLSLSFMQRKWDPYPILVQLTRVLALVKRLTYVHVLTIRFESDSYARDVDGRGTDPTRRVRGRKEKRDGEGEGVGGVGERWAVMLSKILELVVREKGCREVRVLNHSFWIREVFPVLEEMGKVGVLAAPVVAIRDWVRVGLSMDWARGMRQLLHSPLSMDCFLRGQADRECKQMTGLKSFLIQSPILLLPPTLGHTVHLFSHSPALTSLTLSRLSLLPRLFADALVLLVSSLTNPLALRSLSIQSCETLTLPLLLSILHHLPAIETLRVDLLARRYFHKKSLRLLVPPLNKLRCLEAPSDYVLVLLGGRSVKGRFEKLEKVWVYPRTCWTAAFGYKRSSVEMKKIVKRVIEIGSESGEVELALDLKLAYLTYRLNMRADIKDRMDEIRRWEGDGKGMCSEKGRGGLGLYDGTVRESMFYVVGSQYGDGSDGAGDGVPWIIDEGLSRIGHRRGCGLSIGKRNKSWSWGVHVSHVAVTWHDIVKDDLAVLVMWVRTLFPRVVSLRLTAEISGVEEWERTRRGGRCVHLPREGSMFEGLSWGGALTPSGEHEFVFDVEDMGGIVRPEHGERDNGNGVGRVEKRALELIMELRKAGCTQIEWVTVDGKRYATQ